MTFQTEPGVLNKIANQPIARTLAYYLVLAALAAILYQIVPDLPGVFTSGSLHVVGASKSALRDTAPLVDTVGPLEIIFEALIAMTGAYLLMLPVAWIYIYTRRKRGYQQSLVQVLVVLPIVVAGVVILVKTSIALAFSLGGIVGAIAFRNRLDDTKDAVTIFLAIGVGVAAGVGVMGVAATLSIFYNLINLILWYTDFGRSPAQLEGPGAERRLAQLRQQAERSGAFVSRVDSLLLKSMTPEQLEVLTERARRRQRNLANQIGRDARTAVDKDDEDERDEKEEKEGKEKGKKFDGQLKIVVQSGELESLRRQIEAVLELQTKRWAFESVAAQDGGRQQLQYKVRTKKSIATPLLVEGVRRSVLGRAISVELI